MTRRGTRRPAAVEPGQDGLFDTGQPAVPAPCATEPPRTTGSGTRQVVNDMAVVEAVVEWACGQGYTLLDGPDRTVYRRAGGNTGLIEATDPDEAAAVLQLLDQGLFTVGGQHWVGTGRRVMQAHAILVSAQLRPRAARWRTYIRPTTWP